MARVELRDIVTDADRAAALALQMRAASGASFAHGCVRECVSTQRTKVCQPMSLDA